MLNSISYSFNNRFLSRFIIMHKLNLDQVNLMPTLNKIVLFFSLKDLETLDDVRIYNYFYFFKFFFGLRASFAGYKSFFNLGKTTFNVKIQLILTNNDIYSCLKFFSNDVFALLDASYISLKTSKIFDNVYVYNYVLKDMNMFVEKKTNVGLFNLKDSLSIKLFISSKTDYSIILLQSFKIYL